MIDVGGWQAEQPTEDIAISWDMQTAGWQACFAPHIRFFMDVPETHYRNSLSNGEDGLPVGFTCS